MTKFFLMSVLGTVLLVGLRNPLKAEESTLVLEYVHPPLSPLSVSAPVNTAPPRAWTRGRFSVDYEITLSEDHVYRSKNVSVKVINQVRYKNPLPSASLKRHEAVHEAINNAHAKPIEEELSRFTLDSRQGRVSLAQAKEAFLDKFKELLSRVDALHKDWDKNDPHP